MNSASRSTLSTRAFAQLQQVIHLRCVEERQPRRQFGHVASTTATGQRGRPRPRPAPPAAPATLSPTVTGVFLSRLPTDAFSGRMPCIQCSNCWLLSSHAAKMARTTFWRGSTGVQRVFPGIFSFVEESIDGGLASGVSRANIWKYPAHRMNERSLVIQELLGSLVHL